MKRLIVLVLMGLVICFSIFAEGAQEEDLSNYPTEPITMMIPWSPGGGSDVTAQQLLPVWEPILGQRVVKEFKPGGGAEVGWTTYAKADPDPYRMAIINVPAIIAHIVRSPETVGYSLDDYDMVGNAVADPGGLFVPADSRFETFDDMLEYLKENPEKVTAGHCGVGSDAWFVYQEFEEKANVKFSPVAFEGDGPNKTAAMGGHIDITFNKVGIVSQAVNDGFLRPLLLITDERLDIYPEIPTAKEKGINMTPWASTRGVAVRAGTPENVRQILEDTLKEAVLSEEFGKNCESIDLMVDWMNGDEYRQHMEKVKESYEKIWEKVQ